MSNTQTKKINLPFEIPFLTGLGIKLFFKNFWVFFRISVLFSGIFFITYLVLKPFLQDFTSKLLLISVSSEYIDMLLSLMFFIMLPGILKNSPIQISKFLPYFFKKYFNTIIIVLGVFMPIKILITSFMTIPGMIIFLTVMYLPALMLITKSSLLPQVKHSVMIFFGFPLQSILIILVPFIIYVVFSMIPMTYFIVSIFANEAVLDSSSITLEEKTKILLTTFIDFQDIPGGVRFFAVLVIGGIMRTLHALLFSLLTLSFLRICIPSSIQGFLHQYNIEIYSDENSFKFNNTNFSEPADLVSNNQNNEPETDRVNSDENQVESQTETESPENSSSQENEDDKPNKPDSPPDKKDLGDIFR